MRIGNVELDSNYFLAPLAGVSDVAYRGIAGRMGAALTYTEMVSSKAIVYKNKNTNILLDTSQDVVPVAVQLFGSDPQFISESIKMIEDLPFSIIDFNMGCPVPKVVKNGEGSALMNNPKLIYEIISTAKKTTNKPITAKIRKGFEKENALEVAKAIEEAGADAIAIHGRTRGQYYSGKADWDIIAEIKDELKIPVIGNGDVDSPEKFVEMLNYTKCDAVLIGRAAQGNPFIFRQIKEYLETGTYENVKLAELKEVIFEHAEKLILTKGERVGMQELRKHVAWYIHGMHGASNLRKEAMSMVCLDDLKSLLLKIDVLTTDSN